MMKNKDISVVICAAGMGTRLGIGTTKALVHVCGKPLIIRQLELLNDYDDVRIVLGYQADKVMEVVNKYRKDIMFAFNYDYANTGAAASLSKGILGARKYVVSIDGDLLINKDDFCKFMQYDGECIAVSECYSDEPAKIEVINDKATRFGVDSRYEWPGLAKVRKANLKEHNGYTYEVLQKILPMQTFFVDARDIDTPDDYDRAIEWAKNSNVYV